MQQSSLRLVRIVWPNEGTDIQIVGSFNGWATPVSMSPQPTCLGPMLHASKGP